MGGRRQSVHRGFSQPHLGLSLAVQQVHWAYGRFLLWTEEKAYYWEKRGDVLLEEAEAAKLTTAVGSAGYSATLLCRPVFSTQVCQKGPPPAQNQLSLDSAVQG